MLAFYIQVFSSEKVLGTLRILMTNKSLLTVFLLALPTLLLSLIHI